MIFLCMAFPTLSQFSDIAEIVIAICNFFLAFYVFVYTRKSNQNTNLQALNQHRDNLLLHQQNMKRQWLNELVISPNSNNIRDTYAKIESICERCCIRDLNDDIKLEIITKLKLETKSFRKSFIDSIRAIDSALGTEVQKNIDDMLDTLTTNIYCDEYRFDVQATYDKYILELIQISRNNLFSSISNYPRPIK